MKRYSMIQSGNDADHSMPLKEVLASTDFSNDEVDQISDLLIGEDLEIDDIIITRTA